jgi:hypothetical protein
LKRVNYFNLILLVGWVGRGGGGSSSSWGTSKIEQTTTTKIAVAVSKGATFYL